MRRVYALPAVKGARVRDYVIVDVLNEPDNSWLKCACDRASQHVHFVHQQSSTGTHAHSWGRHGLPAFPELYWKAHTVSENMTCRPA